MKALFLTMVSVMVTASALANPVATSHRDRVGRCLQMATNSEILNELNYRLRSTSVPMPISKEESVTSVSCDYSTLNISTTNLTTGDSNLQKVELGGSSQCAATVELINAALNSHLTKNKLIGTCDYSTLSKFMVTTEKQIKHLAKENYGSSSQCQTVAKQLNKVN